MLMYQVACGKRRCSSTHPGMLLYLRQTLRQRFVCQQGLSPDRCMASSGRIILTCSGWKGEGGTEPELQD